MSKEKTLINTLSLYLILFFLFCVLGWIYEVVLGFIYGHGFVNRGFLFGPYLPVYGFGALLLVVSLRKIMQKPIRIGKFPITPFIVFILIFIITTVIEFYTSYFMELLFHKRWWDYSTDFMNINGRVCLRTSFRFGLGGMLFLYVLTPFFTMIINKLSQKLKYIIAFGILSVMTADLLRTVILIVL